MRVQPEADGRSDSVWRCVKGAIKKKLRGGRLARSVYLNWGQHVISEERHARPSVRVSSSVSVGNTRTPYLAVIIDATRSPAVTRPNTIFFAWRERGAGARVDAVRSRIKHLLSGCSPIRSYCFHRCMMLSSSIVPFPRHTSKVPI